METVRLHNVMVILEKDGEKWFWEISTFQSTDDECYGSAIERNREITLPWIKIEDMNLTETMVKVCQSFMEKFNK